MLGWVTVGAIGCLLACTPCKDGSRPEEGTCTCEDGTKLSADECPACDSTAIEELGDALSFRKRATTIKDCPPEYTLDVRAPSRLSIALSSVGGSASVRIMDIGHADKLGSLSTSGSEVHQDLVLDKGRYMLLVETASVGAIGFEINAKVEPYAADVESRAAGRSKEYAADLGAIEQLSRNRGYVGPGQSEAFYKFTLPENATLSWQLSHVIGNTKADLYLAADVLNKAMPLKTLMASEGADATADTNLEGGDYYVRVAAGVTALYTLALVAELYHPAQPRPEPGNNADDAFDLKTLGALKEYGGFVGSSDPEDYYRFELSSNAVLHIQLSHVLGAVTAQLFAERALIDVNKPDASFAASTAAEETYSDGLPEGRYLLRIVPGRNSEVLYKLSLSVEGEP